MTKNNVTYLSDPDVGVFVALCLEDTDVESVVLDTNITAIASGAFMNCSKLKNINLGELSMLEYIGEKAFYGCTGLTSITIPNNNNFVLDIEDSAFYNCVNIEYVYNYSDLQLVAGSEDYGYVAYYAQIVWNKDDLTNGQPILETYVENNVVYTRDSVNNKLFVASVLDKKIYNIELNSNTTEILKDAFAKCVNLQSIDLKNTKIKVIGDNAFKDCINLKFVNVPNTLMFIGNNAFEYCRSLQELSLPKSLQTIGNNAFKSCIGLKTIVFEENSELTSIGDYAFSDCISLKSFDMPDSVTSIGSNVFDNCLSLESVTISSNLKSIPSFCFQYCENLRTVVIPEGITSISYDTFRNCTSLSEVQLPDSLKTIGSSAFEGCSSLQSIEIPEGVTSIGSRAFYNCISLKKVEISPSSKLTEIESGVFANCSSLESILLPSKLNYIYTSSSDYDKSSFENCTNLAFVYNYSALYVSIGDSNNGEVALNAYVVYNNEQYDFTIDDIIFETIGNVKYYIEPITNYYVAYEIVDKSQEVVFDVKTNRIGPKLFYNNSNLTSIDLQNLSNLIEICAQAFYDCSELTSVALPNNLKYIENYAFQNCSKLVNVILPEGLLKIGDYAFSNCSALSSIDIPDSLIEIGKNAFDDCSALSSVLINDSSNLQIIGSDAFYNCAELETITIPEKVIKIGSYAFYDSGLKTAVFKSPSGWGYMSESKFYEISESSLSNSSTAAYYLSDYSSYYYWTWEKIS